MHQPQPQAATRGALPIPVSSAFDAMRFGAPHWRVAIALFVLFVIESWEQLSLVYVADDLVADFGIDETQLGWLLSAVATGMIIGCLFWGPLADRFGRRKIATISMATYGVVALASAFAQDFTTLFVIRIVSGILFAGVYTIVFPYFMELMPTSARGRATVLLSIGWPIGILAALGVSVVFADLGWRVVAIASAVVCAWIFIVRAWVPESPYWLVGAGKHAEAAKVLRSLGADVAEDTTFVPDERPYGKVLDLVRKPLLRITIPMLMVNFFFNWGYWGLQVWLPTLLQERGLSLDTSLAFVAISAVFMIPGYLVAGALTKRYGRKRVFLLFLGGAIVGGVLFAMSWDVPSLYVANFLLSFFILGGWGIWNAWNSELYPTNVRASGMSWATTAQLVSNAIAPPIVGLLLSQSVSFLFTMLIIVVFLLVAFVVACLLPETEGEPLD